MTGAELAARVDGRRNGAGWSAKCPAHEDRRASLSIGEGDDGRALLKCHAGCGLGAILDKLGLREADLFPAREPGAAHARGRIVATYDYTDQAGVLLYQVVRFEPKDFRQRRPDGVGGWTWSLDGVRRVLYRLPRVLGTAKASGVVYVVEGEKDVEALEALGLVATCNAGGAGKWRPEYAEHFGGLRGVVTLPDNDSPGRAHARDVARSLHAAGVPVKLLELPILPEKGDVSDWLAAGGTRARLDELRKAAPRWEPASEADAMRAADPEADDSPAVLVKVSSVEPERVEWLWMHRIPRGKVTVLDGDPGLGKSTMTLDLAARVSTGRPMPGDEREREPAGVVLLTAEDGIADTIRPRLEAAGGDLERVAVLTAVRDSDGKPRLPVIPDDVEPIRQALRAVGASLLVVDPLMAFLNGRVDSHRDQDVRGALHLLADLAGCEGVSVVIVRHLNKAGGGHPIYRGGGSIGIIGAARAGLLVAPDPKDDTRRVVAVSKSNLGPVPPSLAYRLVQSGDASRIDWEGVAEGCSASDLLAAQRDDGEGAGPREEAEAFLRELLAQGPVPAKDVERDRRAAGISERTLDRAKARLGVRARKEGRPGEAGRWAWSLPEERHEPSKGAKGANPDGWHPSAEVGTLRGPAPPQDEEIIT